MKNNIESALINRAMEIRKELCNGAKHIVWKVETINNKEVIINIREDTSLKEQRENE